jgi:hypothetical protein
MASNLNPKDILTAFKTTLTASPSLIPDSVQQIQIGVDIDTSVGFPFVRIYLENFDSPIADTISYERQYVFNIDILQEFTNKSKEDAEKDLANALHKVLNRLQATGGTPPTWQLGIGVEKMEIESSPIQTVAINGSPMRMAKIRVIITTLIENPS